MDGNTPRLQCPICANDDLPELFEPAGLIVCPSCGHLLRRTEGSVRSLGKGPSGLIDLVRNHLEGRESLQPIFDDVISVVTDRGAISEGELLQIARGRGLDSLDIVEVVMAIEEELQVKVRTK